MSSQLIFQLIWNGLVSGSLIALVALGLTLVYGIAGFIQFAHGELVAWGAYSFMVLHKLMHWPILPSILGSIIILLAIGILTEKLFFRPVRDKNPMIPLVSSIGLSIGFQSIILMIFGPNILTITDKSYKSLPLLQGQILATPNQILALLCSVVLIISLGAFLKYTKVGKSLRAVASNRELAQSFGLSIDKAMSWIFGIGAVLACLAGIFLGFEQNLEPLMGVVIGVKAFSALILGGVGSIRGAIVGAYAIGLLESLLVGLSLIPSGFTAAIPFIILILMLLIKPEGLFGKRHVALRR
ncbi:MAG TPA: branched-chain amino acid ABC transporter permease [Candidatus Gracilibacteria bacterium]